MPVSRPILKSCCCWRSVRKGSYAAGIYTLIYFIISAGMMANFVYEERRYLMGNQTSPESNSFLEPETITDATMVVNLLLLVCSVLGVVATGLLFVGLQKDERHLLFPWILVVAVDTLIELFHSGYMFVLETINFNPITAILFTLDFFLVLGHIYALLCVISQYQEYLMGRGTAEDYRSDLVTRQLAMTEFSRAQHSPPQSLLAARTFECKPIISCANSSTTIDLKPASTGIKKRVQFPDEKTVRFAGIPSIDSAPPSPSKDEEFIESAETITCVVSMNVEPVEKDEEEGVEGDGKEDEKEEMTENGDVPNLCDE